jgi:signal transduction histidine kinase
MQAGRLAGRFRPLDFFKLTSLVAFIVVAIALFFLERGEHIFFQSIERDQSALFAQAQAELVREQKAAARSSLMMEHEAGHLTLAILLANSLWDSHFAPLVAAAQKLPLDECRALARAEASRSATRPNESKTCFTALGTSIMALPRFAQVDAAVHAMMKGSTVFKVKVYDQRGLTVYSSEANQIGEDKADNRGWQAAARGQPASELVHRDRFSAFEGLVENRDLIQSYIPVLAGGQRISGVFEIYSDVTPLLKQIDAVSQKIGSIAVANQAKVEAASLETGNKVETNSKVHFAVLFSLLVALYVALFLLARNSQRIVDEHARAEEAAARREQLWHREKMAALATMAANASHEIGNPLAIISGLAEDLGRAHAAGESVDGHAEQILVQTSRIAAMTRRITMFASARSESPEPLDVNEMIQGVREFLSFDTRFGGTRIEAALAESLPVCVGIPDHLNEVLMSLLQAHAEASLKAAGSAAGRVRIQTEARGKEAMIRIGCEGRPASGPCVTNADPRLDSARRRVEGMGGRFTVTDRALEIFLPCFSPGAAVS